MRYIIFLTDCVEYATTGIRSTVLWFAKQYATTTQLRHWNITLHNVLYPGKMDATSLHHSTFRWIFLIFYLLIYWFFGTASRLAVNTLIFLFISLIRSLIDNTIIGVRDVELATWMSQLGIRTTAFRIGNKMCYHYITVKLI